MRQGSAARLPSSLEIRAIRFEDVPEVLRLIHRAVERGCRHHYDPAQRGAVTVSYAQNLFVESLLAPVRAIRSSSRFAEAYLRAAGRAGV